MNARRSRDSAVRLLLVPGLPGLEVVRLRCAPRFEELGPHAHDSLILAAVRAGERRVRLDGAGSVFSTAEQVAGPGSCCVVLPGVLHVCSWAAGSVVDCLCIKRPLLKSFMFDVKTAIGGPVLDDAVLHEAVCACAERCARMRAGAAQRGASVGGDPVALLGGILARLAGRRGRVGAAFDVPEALRRARELLDENAEVEGEPLRCSELARRVGLSPWALSRGFVRAFGAPPREYALDRRVHAARRLLALGRAPAQVALETGFFDQSHFIRRFRALVGLTPGQYAAAFVPARKGVPEAGRP